MDSICVLGIVPGMDIKHRGKNPDFLYLLWRFHYSGRERDIEQKNTSNYINEKLW